MPKADLTHLDAHGAARMVHVGGKPITSRRAVAVGFVRCSAELVARLRQDGIGKGDMLQVARLAGIQAAKRTDELIPLCHTLPMDGVRVDLAVEDAGVSIRAEARAAWKTGVEMEALTAVAVAALTVIDMGKAVDKGMVIEGVRVVEKSGGRSGTYRAEGERQ
ncbi:MAG: cyclic pyranopterin monophosphate synthase MoaC [Phycisphaeraceae bacterium]|nr:cyclic pyranopterin monophosphate synthase MoaC [Phycisphaeraceae bacterium]